MAIAIITAASTLASTKIIASIEFVLETLDSPRLVTTAIVPGPVVSGRVWGIKGLVERIAIRNAIPRSLRFLLAALVQELPSSHGDDNAARNAKHGYRNPIELQNKCAEEK